MKYFSLWVLVWATIAGAQESGDLIKRYISLHPEDLVKLTVDGALIKCRHQGNSLQIEILSVPNPLAVEQNQVLHLEPAAKKCSGALAAGAVESRQWQNIPPGYYLEITTRLGIFRAGEYMYWDQKERRLNLIPGPIAPSADLPPPLKFSGSIASDGAVVRIVVKSGGAAFQLPSGKEIWFHHSALETGVQFVSKIPYLMPEDIEAEINRLSEQPAEVRDVTPGQS